MKVRYKLSIGYPQAVRVGEIDIDNEDLEGLEGKAQDAKIDELVWEDLGQYIEFPWEIIKE